MGALTAIPPRPLHWLRDQLDHLRGLVELGLALLCPCDDDHGAGARWLHGLDGDPHVDEVDVPEELRW